MKKFIKVKHKEGVLFNGSRFTYEGLSKIDGYPLYSYESTEMQNANYTSWKGYYANFIFNCRPGYTPQESDFEHVPSLEDCAPMKSMTERYSGKNILGTDDIIQVQPLNGPIGKLFYFDYVYESEFDNRLLLML
jgi:hypothetical protein